MVPTAPWSEVDAGLPQSGRPLLACFNDEVVTVFASFGPDIAEFALRRGSLGGDSWRVGRITRFRLCFGDLFHHTSGGGQAGQEHLLAIHLQRDKFDGMLRQAVHWRVFPEGLYQTKGQWRLATRYAQAVMDWCPERGPDGAELGRSCVRFGVRDHLQKSFSSSWIVGIESMNAIGKGWAMGSNPLTPIVRSYPVPEVCRASLSWDPEAVHVP